MSCSRRKMQSSALVSAQSSPRHRFLNGTQKNPISSSFSLPSISPSLVTKILVILPQEPQFTVFVANGKKIWRYALSGNNPVSNRDGKKPSEMCYPSLSWHLKHSQQYVCPSFFFAPYVWIWLKSCHFILSPASPNLQMNRYFWQQNCSQLTNHVFIFSLSHKVFSTEKQDDVISN